MDNRHRSQDKPEIEISRQGFKAVIVNMFKYP